MANSRWIASATTTIVLAMSLLAALSCASAVIAQTTQPPIDTRPQAAPPAGTADTPASTSDSTSKRNARKRGRLPDLSTMCEVLPPCPIGCRPDVKKNICVENLTP